MMRKMMTDEELIKLWQEDIKEQEKPPLVFSSTPNGTSMMHQVFQRYQREIDTHRHYRTINITPERWANN